MEQITNSMPLGTVIVNTPLVRVEKTKDGFSMFLNAADGSVIEHQPFPPNLEGMVAAISLSAEICAGKFYIKKVASVPKERATLDFTKKGGL